MNRNTVDNFSSIKKLASLISGAAMILLFTACQTKSDAMLAFESGLASYTPSTLVWIDREGRVEPINLPERNYVYSQISPDGKYIAINSRDETSDIWIFDLETESLRKLTPDLESNIGPLWMSDGRLAFTRMYDGKQEIVLQPADLLSSAKPLTLAFTHDANKFPTSFSEDGETLIFHSSPSGYDMWSLTLAGENNNAQSLFSSDSRETNGVLSPDGRWLAYELGETFDLNVFVSPFPEVDSNRIKISQSGGSRPHWSSDGSEIFFIDQYESELSGAMMAADFDKESGSLVGNPQLLFEGIFHSPLAGQGRQLYDVSADDQRFLMIQKTQ